MRAELASTKRIAMHAAALAALLLLAASPAFGQMAKTKKQEAATGQSSGGNVPLHVGLVISDATRAYHTMVMLTHVEFGRRLGDKAVKIFNETFVSVQQMTAPPAGPQGYNGLDVVVVVEVVDGRAQTALFSLTTFSLTARFTVFNSSGQQILQLQEAASDKNGSPAAGPDAVGEAVVRKFIQDMVLSPAIRNILSPPPAPAAAVAVAAPPARDDSPMLASAGLEVPPPAPWVRPSAADSAVVPGPPAPDGRP